ncbi:hypothetical protein [Aeromonas allosaccharophila]|uniref:Uncharacterized protein n=1 Tax=Aeromonas allosaccharophila TaxID=656 RepID=A0AAX3NKN6_9GAMM|nr:hypothetical protein [Aeromonas allosaccharophila]WED74628.1 hypothetical protein PYU98_11615 [Aeromonas allosaccharophila]
MVGKSVDVTLDLPQQTDTHLFCLPAMAVNSLDRQWHVWQVDAGRVVRVPVSPHGQQRDALCVNGELATGDQLVVAGSTFVSEGEQVAIMADPSQERVAKS